MNTESLKKYVPEGAAVLYRLDAAEGNKKYDAVVLNGHDAASEEKAAGLLRPSGVIMLDMGDVNVASAAARLNGERWEVLESFRDEERAFVIARRLKDGGEAVDISGRERRCAVRIDELERMIAEEEAKKPKALKICAATVIVCAALIALLAWRFETDEAPLYLLGAPVMFIGACVVLAHGKDYVRASEKVRELKKTATGL